MSSSVFSTPHQHKGSGRKEQQPGKSDIFPRLYDKFENTVFRLSTGPGIITREIDVFFPRPVPRLVHPEGVTLPVNDDHGPEVGRDTVTTFIELGLEGVEPEGITQRMGFPFAGISLVDGLPHVHGRAHGAHVGRTESQGGDEDEETGMIQIKSDAVGSLVSQQDKEKIGKKHEQAGIENPRFLPFEPGKENHQKGIQDRQEYGNDSCLSRREGSHQRTLRLFPVQDIQPADESQQHDRVHRKGKNPRVGIAEKKLEESRRQKYEDKQV